MSKESQEKILQKLKPAKYRLSTGTVQAYVFCNDPWFMVHFGRVEYAREKPILTESLATQGQKVCDLLNDGKITREEAKQLLAKIYW